MALWITLMPGGLEEVEELDGVVAGRLDDASTPESTIACAYSMYGGGVMAGRIVRFTPNGLSVSSRHRSISLTRSSGVGCVSAVSSPSAPALATAATSSARPTHCMPPWTIGCSMPNASVNLVVRHFALSCWGSGAGKGGDRVYAVPTMSPSSERAITSRWISLVPS